MEKVSAMPSQSVDKQIHGYVRANSSWGSSEARCRTWASRNTRSAATLKGPRIPTVSASIASPNSDICLREASARSWRNPMAASIGLAETEFQYFRTETK